MKLIRDSQKPAKLEIAHWWNNTEILREKPVRVSLVPSQMPHELASNRSQVKKRPVKYFVHTVLFWITIACSVVGVYRRFERICCLDLQSSELCARVILNSLKADSHITCRAHAVPLLFRAAKGLECVFPIWFTQCGRVGFTLAMLRPCHVLTMPFFSRPRHGQSMASLNQTRPHCCKSNAKDTF